MVKILIFTVLMSFSSFANEMQKVEHKKDVKIDTIDDITRHLEDKIKKEQPFDEKDVKIDVESLGLDNVEEEAPKKEVEKKVKKKLENIKKVEKIEDKKEDNFLTKIQGFIEDSPVEKVEKKLEKIIKKPIFIKKPKKIVKKEEKTQKDAKQERLNLLRKRYLRNLAENEVKFYDFEREIVKPRPKNLDWSDKFTSNLLPPPPIMSPFRGSENNHIPRVLVAKEKIDIMFDAIAKKDVNAFNQAYRYVINPDSVNRFGDTILTNALILQQYPIILSVLQKGADPDLANRLGHTPLDIAIEMLDLKAAKILLDMEANVNYVSVGGSTYLMQAVQSGYLPMVRLLVERGAEINARDDTNRTALLIANRRKKAIIARYLVKRGAKIWPEKRIVRPKPKTSIIKELENKWR